MPETTKKFRSSPNGHEVSNEVKEEKNMIKHYSNKTVPCKELAT